MSWSQPPEMQIGEPVAFGLDDVTHIVGHRTIGIHVEQDRAGVADRGRKTSWR